MVVDARDSNLKKDYVDARNSRNKKNPVTGLKNITLWKQQVFEELLSDQELMKLLYYSTSDWHSRPDLTEDEIANLNGTQVFPFKFMDNNIESDKKSFISVDIAHFVPLEEFRLFSRKYIHGYLYFYILVDKDIMLTEMGVRSDLIIARVYDLFQNARIGVGEMTMDTQTPLTTDNNHFIGYTVGFKLAELG